MPFFLSYLHFLGLIFTSKILDSFFIYKFNKKFNKFLLIKSKNDYFFTLITHIYNLTHYIHHYNLYSNIIYFQENQQYLFYFNLTIFIYFNRFHLNFNCLIITYLLIVITKFMGDNVIKGWFWFYHLKDYNYNFKSFWKYLCFLWQKLI